MPLLTRRTFLIAAVALAPAARVAARQPGASISHDQFMRLSRRLVGNHQLDPQVGAIYRDALLAVPDNGPRLARLARLTSPATDSADAALAARCVDAGVPPFDDHPLERRVATHTSALMWRASGTAPPGSCASAFGAWSQRPRIV